MLIKVGQTVWLPCEVKRGPFSDERLIRIESDLGGEWVGFVPVWSLKDSIEEGQTHVRAAVLEVHGTTFTARVPGHAVTPGVFQGQVSKVERIGSF